jgi:hypothetical protein
LRFVYVRTRDCACAQIPQTAATGNCLTPAIEPPIRLPLRDPLPLDPAVHSAPLIGSFQFCRQAEGYSPVMLHASALNPASLARFAETVICLSAPFLRFAVNHSVCCSLLQHRTEI